MSNVGHRVRLVVVIAGLALSALAEEMVTIPKSRLQDLERKEAELEKLKAELSKAKGENVQLKRPHAEAVAKIAGAPANEPVVTHVSPPMASLPPLKEGEMVDAVDLANHYRAGAAAADERYRKQKFKVRGEVAGFEKPMF